jgi:hypothetical protein
MSAENRTTTPMFKFLNSYHTSNMTTTVDPRLYLSPLDVEPNSTNSESPLSTSPGTLSSSTTQEQILTPQFYGLPTELVDLSMYDPGLLPDSYFTDSYLPTDPMFLGDLDLDALAELPFNTSNSFDTTPKPSLTPSSTVDGRYKMSPVSSQNEINSSSLPFEVTTEGEDTIDVAKRLRGSQADNISACWNSPLCPNNTKEGTPPNPSTCNGGCAPFLFGDAPLSDESIDTALLAIDIAAEDNYSPIDMPKSKLKRSESSTTGSNPPRIGGRQSKGTTGTRSTKKSSGTEQEPIAESIEEAEPKEKKRIPHNEVERKYRDSVNNQMDCLRRVVPVLQPTPRICDGADMEDLPAPSKPSKAAILASATAYIKQLEREKKEQRELNEMLQARVRRLQALVKCDDCSIMQYVKNIRIKGGNT